MEEQKARFKPANQGHVFKFLDAGKVPKDDEAAFLEQLKAIQPEKLPGILKGAREFEAQAGGALSPVEASESCAVRRAGAKDTNALRGAGLKVIKAGEAAVLVL